MRFMLFAEKNLLGGLGRVKISSELPSSSDVLRVMSSSSKMIIEIDLEKDQESPACLISQFRTLLSGRAKSFEVWFGKNFSMMSRRAEPL